MDLTYPIILLAVFLISPIVLLIASKQGKVVKRNLKIGFLILLLLELVFGLFNWESFSEPGRSGFTLSITYPTSFLGLFFIVALVQVILLFIPKRPAHIIAVCLNFVNTVLFFVGAILVSNTIGKQIFSLWSIGAVFAVLIGNVVGLMFLNKDRKLLSKFQ